MKLFTSDDADWLDVEDEPDGEVRARVDSRLRQLLGAERLVVLSGLGTSLCIRLEDETVRPPGMAELWNAAQDATDETTWERALEAARWTKDFDDDIELLLSRCQMAYELSGDDDLADFIRACEKAIVSACRFVKPTTSLPEHEIFLRRIGRRPTRLPRTQIFTTNYDQAFEVAASRTGFAVIDGFSHVSPQRFDSSFFDVDLAVRDRERAATAVEWMPNVIQLLKLHGSVDWDSSGEGAVRVEQPARPLIVYPRMNKFEVSYQPPFLDLMARFQVAVRRPETAIIVIGSGLRDRHIAEPLLAAVNTNLRMSLLIVAPDVEATESAAVSEIKRLIERGDRRLGLLSATFEQFVDLTPDLVSQTEEERHRERLAR